VYIAGNVRVECSFSLEFKDLGMLSVLDSKRLEAQLVLGRLPFAVTLQQKVAHYACRIVLFRNHRTSSRVSI
jgi:hypothetical protein